MKKALFIFLLLPCLVKAQNNRLPVAGSTTKDTVEVLNGLIEDSAFKVKIMNMITGASSDKVVVHASDSTLRELPFPAYTLDQVTANGSTYSANRNIANAGHTIVYTGTGQWLFGGTSSIVGSYVEITSTTTPQLSLVYDGTHFLGIGVASDGTATLTPSGKTVKLTAATTVGASLNVPSGTAPTSPNNGDFWYDGTHAQMRLNGVTVALDANLYNTDGALTGNRTITEGSDYLIFNGGVANVQQNTAGTFNWGSFVNTNAHWQFGYITPPLSTGVFNHGTVDIDSTMNMSIPGNLLLTNAGHGISIAEGSNSKIGQTTLVTGTKAISITGLTTSSRAFVTLVSQGGTTTTTAAYIGVCTSNTLTISAVTAAGTNTVNGSDTSILNYFIIN